MSRKTWIILISTLLIVTSYLTINILPSFLSAATTNNEVLSSTNLTVDKTGNLLVVEDWNKLKNFSPDGKLIGELYSYGKKGKKFGSIAGVQVDNEGNIYILTIDLFKTIQKFSPEGKFISSFPLRRLPNNSVVRFIYTGLGIYRIPIGLHLPFTIHDNSIYTAETSFLFSPSIPFNQKYRNKISIKSFDLDGTLQKTVASTIIRDAFHSVNRMFINEPSIVITEDERLNIFNTEGNFVNFVGSKDGYVPLNTTLLEDGNILVMLQNWSLKSYKFSVYSTNGQFIKTLNIEHFYTFTNLKKREGYTLTEFNQIAHDTFDMVATKNKLYLANFKHGILVGDI